MTMTDDDPSRMVIKTERTRYYMNQYGDYVAETIIDTQVLTVVLSEPPPDPPQE